MEVFVEVTYAGVYFQENGYVRNVCCTIFIRYQM